LQPTSFIEGDDEKWVPSIRSVNFPHPICY